eukprot:12831030-Alexandrium_andersonii.AAC.1
MIDEAAHAVGWATVVGATCAVKRVGLYEAEDTVDAAGVGGLDEAAHAVGTGIDAPGPAAVGHVGAGA